MQTEPLTISYDYYEGKDVTWNHPSPFPTELEFKSVMAQSERMPAKKTWLNSQYSHRPLSYFLHYGYLSDDKLIEFCQRVIKVRESIDTSQFRHKLAAAQSILDSASIRAQSIIAEAQQWLDDLESARARFALEQTMVIPTWFNSWRIIGEAKYLVLPLTIHIATVEYQNQIAGIPKPFNWSTDYLVHVLDNAGKYDLASSGTELAHPHSSLGRTCAKFGVALPEDVKSSDNRNQLTAMLQSALGGVNYDSLLIPRAQWDMPLRRGIPNPRRKDVYARLQWRPLETITTIQEN